MLASGIEGKLKFVKIIATWRDLIVKCC